jgi:hypothetical protein
MLMQDNEISDVVGAAGFGQFLHDIVSPINSMRVWED